MGLNFNILDRSQVKGALATQFFFGSAKIIFLVKVKNPCHLNLIMVKIEILKEIDQYGTDRLNELMAQLCPECPAHPLTHFREILYHPTSRLLVAMDGESITGCLTLVWYKIPSLTRFWIEDVVVDQKYRGVGIGKALILNAIEMAQKLGGHYIDLTSRTSRIEANHLYQGLGFEKRETNVYRLKL